MTQTRKKRDAQLGTSTDETGSVFRGSEMSHSDRQGDENGLY